MKFKIKAAILILIMFIVVPPRAGLSQVPCFVDNLDDGVADEWTPLTASR